MEYWRFKQNIQ